MTVFATGKKFYPQVFLEEYKQIVNEKKKKRCINTLSMNILNILNVRSQTLHYAGYKNASVQTTKSIIKLKKFLHIILKGAYIEPYLRLFKKLYLGMYLGCFKYPHNIYLILFKKGWKTFISMQNINKVYANKSFF